MEYFMGMVTVTFIYSIFNEMSKIRSESIYISEKFSDSNFLKGFSNVSLKQCAPGTLATADIALGLLSNTRVLQGKLATCISETGAV
jgi:hypothetical protein